MVFAFVSNVVEAVEDSESTSDESSHPGSLSGTPSATNLSRVNGNGYYVASLLELIAFHFSPLSHNHTDTHAFENGKYVWTD